MPRTVAFSETFTVDTKAYSLIELPAEILEKVEENLSSTSIPYIPWPTKRRCTACCDCIMISSANDSLLWVIRHAVLNQWATDALSIISLPVPTLPSLADRVQPWHDFEVRRKRGAGSSHDYGGQDVCSTQRRDLEYAGTFLQLTCYREITVHVDKSSKACIENCASKFTTEGHCSEVFLSVSP